MKSSRLVLAAAAILTSIWAVGLSRPHFKATYSLASPYFGKKAQAQLGEIHQSLEPSGSPRGEVKGHLSGLVPCVFHNSDSEQVVLLGGQSSTLEEVTTSQAPSPDMPPATTVNDVNPESEKPTSSGENKADLTPEVTVEEVRQWLEGFEPAGLIDPQGIELLELPAGQKGLRLRLTRSAEPEGSEELKQRLRDHLAKHPSAGQRLGVNPQDAKDFIIELEVPVPPAMPEPAPAQPEPTPEVTVEEVRQWLEGFEPAGLIDPQAIELLELPAGQKGLRLRLTRSAEAEELKQWEQKLRERLAEHPSAGQRLGVNPRHAQDFIIELEAPAPPTTPQALPIDKKLEEAKGEIAQITGIEVASLRRTVDEGTQQDIWTVEAGESLTPETKKKLEEGAKQVLSKLFGAAAVVVEVLSPEEVAAKKLQAEQKPVEMALPEKAVAAEVPPPPVKPTPPEAPSPAAAPERQPTAPITPAPQGALPASVVPLYVYVLPVPCWQIEVVGCWARAPGRLLSRLFRWLGGTRCCPTYWVCLPPVSCDGCGVMAQSYAPVPTLPQLAVYAGQLSRLLALTQAEQTLALVSSRSARSTTEVVPVAAGAGVREEPSTFSRSAITPAEIIRTGKVSQNETVGELFGRAATLYWARHYREALVLLESAVKLAPEDPRLWYFKGFAELASGDNAAGERSLAKAIYLHETCSPEDKAKVAAAVSRVQGKFRVMLEEVRLRTALPAGWKLPPAQRGTPSIAGSVAGRIVQ